MNKETTTNLHQRLDPDSFKSSLKWSLIAHVVIVLVFTVRAYFFPAEAIDYTAAVRVDIIALPDKIDPSQVTLAKEAAKPAPQPKVKAKPEPIPETKKPVAETKKPEPDAINLKKTKSKQEEALEKLKRQAALDKIKKQVESESKADDTGKADTKQKITQVKGNVLSPGTALTGLNKLQHENYVSTLDQHIKQNWALPEWLANRDFKARARVRIDENGKIVSREIIKSSGNESYDEHVLETIDRSAPFPIPPEKFAAIVSVQGIVIGFPE